MTTITPITDDKEQWDWFNALPRQSQYVKNALRARGFNLRDTISDLVTTTHPETLNPYEWGGFECMLEWAVTQWPGLYTPEVCQRALLNLQYWRRYARKPAE